jgi:hypothetical protein
MLTKIKSNKFKILKRIYNRDKLILIIKANNKKKVLKIFKKKNKSYIRELNGYKKFKFKELSYPRVKKVSLFKNYNTLEMEYIEGKNIGIMDVVFISNSIFSKSAKKISLSRYLNSLYGVFSKEKKLFKLKSFLNILYNKFETSDLYLTLSHGDFSGYNIIKKNKKYYIIDFEKFGKRIIFFDQMNIFFVIFLNRMNNLFNFKNQKFEKYILSRIFSIFRIFLFFMLRDMLKKHNIDYKIFNLYLLLFIFEKTLTFLKDLKYLNNKIEINKVKKKINIMHFFQNLLINENL